MILVFFRKFFALFMSMLSLFFSPIFGDFAADYSPKDPYNCELNFAVISDTHISDSSARASILGLGLTDMADASYPLDALVVSGDITDHGYAEQWENVYNTFSEYNSVKNVILAIGNHDTWTRDDDFESAKQLFIEYNKKICDRDLDNVYYSTKVNGYSFIVIGSEKDMTAAYISDEQPAWLDNAMYEASLDGLPIFVVCHQPVNGSHGLPEMWGDDDMEPDDGGIGDQSDAVEAILKKYENVFMIDGHIHDGFGDSLTEKLYNYKSIESDGSFHSINLPCYMFANAHGEPSLGNGFQFEVYSDKVVIRGRSFTSSVWYTNYEYEIPLV